MNRALKIRLAALVASVVVTSKAHTRILQAVCASAVLSFSGLALAQGADCPPLTVLQQRLLAKAQESPASLRRFIDIRRAILQLDIRETQAWAEAVHTAAPACTRPPSSVALQADEAPTPAPAMR
jgi:hypothetical protein